MDQIKKRKLKQKQKGSLNNRKNGSHEKQLLLTPVAKVMKLKVIMNQRINQLLKKKKKTKERKVHKTDQTEIKADNMNIKAEPEATASA